MFQDWHLVEEGGKIFPMKTWTTLYHFCRYAAWIQSAHVVQKSSVEDLIWSALSLIVPSGDWQEQTQKIPWKKENESSIKDSRSGKTHQMGRASWFQRYANVNTVHPNLKKSGSWCEILLGQAQWFSYMLSYAKTTWIFFFYLIFLSSLDLIWGDFFVLRCCSDFGHPEVLA